MRRRPSVLLISMCVHAVVLGLLGTAPWWSPITNWPMPREVLAFSEPRVADLHDIELPAPPRARATASPASAVTAAPQLAPVVAVSGVAPDTGGAGEAPGTGSLASVVGVESAGPGAIDGVGITAAPPPPPPAPKAQGPVRLVGGFVRPPAKVVHVAPLYPVIARASRVQGVVVLEATIDSGGNVVSATVLRSIPLLDQAAVDAVLQWKFTPTLLNGVAVPVIMTVTVNFQLSQ